MKNLIITNLEIYKSIAEDSYAEMVALVQAGRTPKPDGSEGWILHYDPMQNSFKKAMVSIVFTGMWFEALMHILIVKKFGEEKFKEFDFKSYEEKITLLGVTDSAFLSSLVRFRKTRKELVHEKSHFHNSEIKAAQEEAENAKAIRNFILVQFNHELG